MLLYTKLNKTVQNIFWYTCCCVSYWGSAGSRYRFPKHTATSFICAILFCRRRLSVHAKTLVVFKLCSHASLSLIFIHYFFLPSTTQWTRKKHDTGFTRINYLSNTYHASNDLSIAQNKYINKSITNCSNKTFTVI